MSSESDPVFDDLDHDVEEFDNINDGENVDDVGEVDDTENIGDSSADSTPEEAEPAPEARERTNRLEFLKSMTVYDAMLVASALSISLAVLLMVVELTSFGPIFFQWRTGEAFVEPLVRP